MAKAFVRQLPRIPSYALPSNANCPICAQPYEDLITDSGTFEKAVALPCSDKHIFGSECLTEWLTYGKNCPFCRRGMALPRDLTTDRRTRALAMIMVGDQEIEDYWYRTFWILHLHGDRAVERAWHESRQDYIWAAEQCDESSQAQARAAISLSPLITEKRIGDPRLIRIHAAGIRTLRFREYRLFLRFQTNAGEHPELKAPPNFQLTPAQENGLFHELDRRQAFGQLFGRPPGFSKREVWNMMRDLGYVSDPDWDVSWYNFPGRWRYTY